MLSSVFFSNPSWFCYSTHLESRTLAGAWAGGTEYRVNFVLWNKIVCFVFMCHIVPICHFFRWLRVFSCINTWLAIRVNLRYSKNIAPNLLGLGDFPPSHTNPFRKIPESCFMLIYNFQRIFHQICWARVIIRRKIKSDITDGLTDGRTDRQVN